MNPLEDSSRRKLYVSSSALLLLVLSVATASLARPVSAATIDSGVVIPLYNYPDSTWTTVAQTAKAYPNVPIAVVVNPNSGPGSSADPTYLAAIQNLQSAGVTVLGYVATGYATSSYSSLTNVESQVNLYKSWYHVNGIFFDEMSNVVGYESYYSTLNAYVKSNGMTYTMGNPGTSVPSSYIGILNNLVVYENSGYPSLSFITYPGYPESDFSLIAYGVSYSSSFVTSAASLVSYMYIDNLSGGNPYSTLSSLFTQNVATLAALDPPASSSTTATTTTTTSSGASSTASTGTSALTIASTDTNGNAITGFWTALTDQSGTVVATGYTPDTFTLNNGQTYAVEQDSYGSCNFAYWKDTGSTNYLRNIAITTTTNLTAVYNCGTTTTTTTSSTATSTITSTTTTTATSTATSTTSTTSSALGTKITIKVVSATLTGAQFSGMWTTIQSASGKYLATGYTTLTYKGVSGNIYTVCVANYQTTVFSHWGDGNTNSCRTLIPTSNIALTAYFSTG